MSEELKPCPFCGGKAKFGANKSCCGKTVRIDCTNPECGACVTTFSSKVYAAKAWNRRVQQPNEVLELCDGCINASTAMCYRCIRGDVCRIKYGFTDTYRRPPEGSAT